MDITYIPMKKGYMYLAAIIDLYGRYVINWPVSNLMDTDRCVNWLGEAIEIHGRPEIVNTGQEPQFNSEVFLDCVTSQGIKFSMGGKGKAVNNAIIERLWRSVK